MGLTSRIWSAVKGRMLPTPEHFHYIFNLRDLSRITEGLIDVQGDVVTQPRILLQLWRHECDRVLADRLISSADRLWYEGALTNLLSDEFGAASAQEIMASSPGAEPVLFVDFLRDELDIDDIDGDDPEATFDAPKIYEPIKSMKSLRARLETWLTNYNNEVHGSKLDLVLFEDCIRHIVKVSRIIRRPRGNALLVGVGGSGKQSVTRLAAFIAGHVTFQIAMSRSYTVTKLLEDLQGLYRKTGGDGRPVTFIFTDQDVKDESFLEYINSILTSGDVDVMPQEDLNNLLNDIRPVMRREHPEWEDTLLNLKKFFIERVRANLHIVLCFSPVGDKFRLRSLKFPGLISGCTIDWFEPWPREALYAVSQKFLAGIDLVCEPKVKEEMVKFMSNVHFEVEKMTVRYKNNFRRHVYVTPKSYLSFINSFTAVYAMKKTEIDNEARRMTVGLERLQNAEESVSKLREQLDREEVLLKTAQDETRQQLAKIVVQSAEAQEEKNRVKAVKDQVQLQANDAQAASASADMELAKALPHLKKATAALKVIDPRDINELQSGNNPVHFTQRVMDCVRLMRYLPMEAVEMEKTNGKIKTSWGLSVAMLKKRQFLAALLEFPLQTLNGEIMELVEPYFDDPEFTAARAKSVNAALFGLFEWVVAMRNYYVVSRDIQPKTIAKEKANRKLAIANEELGVAQRNLDEKETKLQETQKQYDAYQAKEQEIANRAYEIKQKMTTASGLISGLSNEKARWTEKKQKFADTIQRLVGDVAVATAFLSYSGGFRQEIRHELMGIWLKDLKIMKIPYSSDVNVVKLLVDDNTIGKWYLEGLPTDEQSTQNGVIVTNCARPDARFPLIIDPQGQGRAWIIQHEQVNELKVVTFETKGFRDILAQCVERGSPMLIEDVREELDPVIDNVLSKGVKLQNARHIICKIGDKEVTFNPEFRLYMTTKFSNPRYTPEICAKTLLIDFTVTQRGLEDQLLGRVIRAEQEFLEKKRMELLEELNRNKKMIKDLEDNLLFKLSHAQGDLVDDPELMQVLKSTKLTSEDVSEKLVKSVENERTINQTREQYRPVATRGSILYFLVSDMGTVNHMYQTSLHQFLEVFDLAIIRAPTTQLAAHRIQNIIEELSFSLYLYVARGLFEDHKFLFLLQMALKIDLDAGNIEFAEYRCLIKGGNSLELGGGKQKKPDDEMPNDVWLNLRALREIPKFYSILDFLEKNWPAWKAWYEKDRPEDATIPDGLGDRLTPFHRLLLIRCFCVDRMYFSAKYYIESALGAPYSKPLPEPLSSAYDESQPLVPIICLLSTGADPSSSIRNLCKQVRKEVPLDVSMGEGQEPHARKQLTEAMQSGHWLLLQNCHLGIPFMEELVMILEQTAAAMSTHPVHPDFRIWITTAPVDDFPISLLHVSLKVTNEPPQGMMAGLRRTLSTISQEQLEHVDRPEWRPLVFAVCFLHSVVQERRKFGPLGWNLQYEFNESDLTASLAFLRKYLYDIDPKSQVDWKTVQYMITEVQYGGRVTDDFDRRLLKTYGKLWLRSEIHHPTQSFKFSPGLDTYCIPTEKTQAGFLDYVSGLPTSDSPELFGLNLNADISYRKAQANSILDTILSIQPKEGQQGGETREAVVDERCQSWLQRLPADFVESHVKQRIETQLSNQVNARGAAQAGGVVVPQPLNIFLFQEIQRMQIVLRLVRKTLSDLRLAIAGTIVLSEQLGEVLTALYDGRVPALWTKVSWMSTSLAFWMKALEDRYKQYTDWLEAGSGTRPVKFYLSGFFNPQGFLTAVLQEYARKMDKSLDQVMPFTSVPKSNKDIRRNDTGVFIVGLILEGAVYDRPSGRLQELPGKKPFSDMPAIAYTGRPKDAEDETMYKCPVYRDARRRDENLIFTVMLRTDHEEGPDHWIKRGVALLTTNV